MAPPKPLGQSPAEHAVTRHQLPYRPSSLDCEPTVFLSPFNGVVTLRKGLAGA